MNGPFLFYEIQNNIGFTQMINVGNDYNQKQIGIVYQAVVEDNDQDIVIIQNNFKIMIARFLYKPQNKNNNNKKIYINL
jgi:hypothetical protein